VTIWRSLSMSLTHYRTRAQYNAWMNDKVYAADDQQTLNVLEELRAGQQQQLKIQAETLEMQRANFDLIKEQYERANKIQDRAEKIQQSGAQLVANARKSMVVAIPFIVLLLGFAGWLLFRMA
jgi:uncharacterized membrane protein (DUF106 family)